jgi:hypothetical protein
MILPQPGEQVILDRPTVGRDRITATLHRPHADKDGRYLAACGRCDITEKCGPKRAAEIAYNEAARTANNDNR